MIRNQQSWNAFYGTTHPQEQFLMLPVLLFAWKNQPLRPPEHSTTDRVVVLEPYAQTHQTYKNQSYVGTVELSMINKNETTMMAPFSSDLAIK